MKNFKLLFVSMFLLLSGTYAFAQNEHFNMRQLACGLSQPWDINWGPDGYLWTTEAYSYQITRIDPVSGNAEMLIDLSDKKNFPDYSEATASTWPQGGLQGIVFHPNFNVTPYVYISYVYQFDGCLPDTMGCYYKTKLVRYTYDMATKTLSNEMVIVDTIPGSNDHNGGRLAIGPVSANKDFLYYGVGEMGAGQLGNAARPHHGQNVDYYEGKILRFNLTPDTDGNYFDSWIPNDNPFNDSLVINDTMRFKQSAVWSLGHRNPQGLVFSPSGILYESEHGPYSDDEINVIKAGYNYGFPLIMGFVDGNYDGSRAGDGSTMPYVGTEAAQKAAIELKYPYSDPLVSLFAASKSAVTTLYTNDVKNTPPFANYYLQYPSVAPSGLAYYSSDAIPGWKNSLLVANLKIASVYRMPVSNEGTPTISDTIPYFKGMGRFRDIAISPDGTKIYVSADSFGIIKGAPGVAVVPPNKGCILEFTYAASGTQESVLNEYVKIAPNPTEAGFTKFILNLDYDARVSVDLYASTGQKMTTVMAPVQGSNFNQTIDMSPYMPGSYFLKVQIDGTTVFKKITHL